MPVTDVRHPRYASVLAYLTEPGPRFTVGVHGAEGAPTYPDGPSIAEIAEAAEFGLGQPQRSWLRAWFDETATELDAVIGQQFQQALIEGQPQSWAAERVALWCQASIQRRIRNGIQPPNSKETIERKGSSTPLIDTGLFRSAIVAYVNGARK